MDLNHPTIAPNNHTRATHATALQGSDSAKAEPGSATPHPLHHVTPTQITGRMSEQPPAMGRSRTEGRCLARLRAAVTAEPMAKPRRNQQTRANLGRLAALPINMAVYFALGVYSTSVGSAMKARESRLPGFTVPLSFVAGALVGGPLGAGLSVTDTVQIIRGKKSQRQTMMVL